MSTNETKINFRDLLAGKEFRLDLSGYDHLPFPEIGRLNTDTVFIKLEQDVTHDSVKANAIEKHNGKLAWIGEWYVIPSIQGTKMAPDFVSANSLDLMALGLFFGRLLQADLRVLSSSHLRYCLPL